MSFYLGKDGSNSQNILHLTSGVTTESAIKSSEPIANTLFHSNLPYLQTIAVEDCPFYTNSLFNGQWNVYSWTVKLSSKVIDLINAGHQFTVLVKTKHSGNTWVATGYYGSFLRIDSRYILYYAYTVGPTSNSLNWPRNHRVISHTNCYLELKGNGKILAGTQYYDNRQDVVYATKVVVYNIRKSDTTTSIKSIGISLDSTKFEITTPTGVLDMRTFYPVQSSPVVTEGSFRSISLGKENIVPYIPDADKTIGWQLSATTAKPSIYKVLNNGTKVQVSSNVNNKLYFSRKVTSTFSVSTRNNTVASPALVSLGLDEIFFVECDITFSSGLAGTRKFKGAAHFVSEGTTQTIGLATTFVEKKGTTYGSYFNLKIRVLNNVVQIVASSNAVGHSSNAEWGTFSGTLHAFVLKI